MPRAWATVAACLLGACANPPTSVVIDVSLGQNVAAPDTLTVEVWSGGALLSSQATDHPPPGRVVIELADGRARTLCVSMRGGNDGGSVPVDVKPHQQTRASLVLSSPPGAGCGAPGSDLGVDLGSDADSTPQDAAVAADLAVADLAPVDLSRAPGIAFVGSATRSLPSAMAFSLARPTGVVEGDYLVVSMFRDGDGDANITPPSGWAGYEKTAADHSAHFTAFWFTHRAGPSEPSSYDFNSPSGMYNTAAVIAAYRGVSAIDTEDVLDDSSGGPYPAPSLSASAAGELLVLAFVADGDFSSETLDWQGTGERGDTGESALFDSWITTLGATGSRGARLFVNSAETSTRHALVWSLLLLP
jgi:hypothetical protein